MLPTPPISPVNNGHALTRKRKFASELECPEGLSREHLVKRRVNKKDGSLKTQRQKEREYFDMLESTDTQESTLALKMPINSIPPHHPPTASAQFINPAMNFPRAVDANELARQTRSEKPKEMLRQEFATLQETVNTYQQRAAKLRAAIEHYEENIKLQPKPVNPAKLCALEKREITRSSKLAEKECEDLRYFLKSLMKKEYLGIIQEVLGFQDTLVELQELFGIRDRDVQRFKGQFEAFKLDAIADLDDSYESFVW